MSPQTSAAAVKRYTSDACFWTEDLEALIINDESKITAYTRNIDLKLDLILSTGPNQIAEIMVSHLHSIL